MAFLLLPSKRSISLMCHVNRWRHLSRSSSTFPIPVANYLAALPLDLRSVHGSITRGGHYLPQAAQLSQLRYCCCLPSSSSASPMTVLIPSNHRPFSTKIDNKHGEEEKQSNRAAFKSTPIIPSILAHIEKIGVGIRKKTKRHNKRRSGPRSGTKGKRGGGDTLDEIEEKDYFTENEAQHKFQRRNRREEVGTKGGRAQTSNKKSSGTNNEKGESTENKGAYWLPPPPFSSFAKSQHDASSDTLNGRKIIRRPVKLIGHAGSLNDNLPRESKGLSEVAIAGRSNVGKSTLLNALLYGNTDESLAPRQFQRGRTPDGAKLPKGVKAVTSSKPGQTKELSFYQLTADVITENDPSEDEAKEIAKMSLLLVDLPGYGFAFAKEERTVEWKNLMHHYLLERRTLKRILLLLDARHGFKKTDFDFLGDLQDGLMAKADGTKAKRELPPIQIVLTKCDLVKRADLARRVVIVREQLSDFLIREPSSLPVMLVSARAGLGFNNIRKETPLGGVLELQRELASLVPVPRAHKGKKNK